MQTDCNKQDIIKVKSITEYQVPGTNTLRVKVRDAIDVSIDVDCEQVPIQAFIAGCTSEAARVIRSPHGLKYLKQHSPSLLAGKHLGVVSSTMSLVRLEAGGRLA